MRVQNRLFLTLPSRMTEEVSFVSWRRWGLEGASLGIILVWADQRTSLVLGPAFLTFPSLPLLLPISSSSSPLSFLSLVKDKNFPVALDTVDANATVRGQGWMDGKELSQVQLLMPLSQGRGLAGPGGSDLLARPLKGGSLFSLPIL